MRILLIFIFFCLHELHAVYTISFFFRAYPTEPDFELAAHWIKKLTIPGDIAQHTLHYLLGHPQVNGIFVTYAGYIIASDLNGEVIFPRKHEKPAFNYLITEKIIPVIIAHNTVGHWELPENQPAHYYSLEKQLDPDSKAYFWKTQQAPLPLNRRIPLDAIVIFAAPQDIYIPLGITVSNESQQLLLPDIYVINKPASQAAETALQLLKVKNFFSEINMRYKKDDTHYETQITHE